MNACIYVKIKTKPKQTPERKKEKEEYARKNTVFLLA